MDIYRFNQLYAHPNMKQNIRKAMLTSDTNVGEAYIREHLEEVITNIAVRLVPEIDVPVLRFDNQKTHSFNRLTALPRAGSAMGEGSTTPTLRSASQRASVELKVMKRKGGVTGFLKDASANYLDQPAAEMENHLLAFANDLRTYMLFGNAGADEYSFSGLDTLIATNRTNKASGGEVLSSLEEIDAMIDANTRRQGLPHRKVLLMSPEMLSSLSRLWTNVRDNRPASRGGTTGLMVDGGYRLETYRYIPILETTSTRPITTMGTVTCTPSGSGATIPDDTYYFQVAAVTWDGEQLACTEVNTGVTSNASLITLAFDAVNNALYYKVYCGLVSGDLSLVKIVSAFSYTDGTPDNSMVEAITFTANPTTVDSDSVPSHMEDDIPLVAGGDYSQPPEYVILWDLDEFQGLGKIAYTNEGGSRFRGLITPHEIYPQDDNYPFLFKSYCALVPSFEATSYIIRGIRTK